MHCALGTPRSPELRTHITGLLWLSYRLRPPSLSPLMEHNFKLWDSFQYWDRLMSPYCGFCVTLSSHEFGTNRCIRMVVVSWDYICTSFSNDQEVSYRKLMSLPQTNFTVLYNFASG